MNLLCEVSAVNAYSLEYFMKLTFKHKYINLSDKEIIERVITSPYDEEAATYLIYDRYEPLCISVCRKVFGGVERLDEVESELFMLLKGKNHDWHSLRSFQWRSKLSTWLKIIAYNQALELRGKLIENKGKNISIDDGWVNEVDKPTTIDIPVDEDTERERKYRMLLLQEAINMLDNPDQKYVVKKRLHGYSSKEVADMLLDYWRRNNIVRYNNKKEIVMPDSGYIDNLFKRGYDKIKKIYKSLDK